MDTNIIREIDKLKKERNALIVAHYYQSKEIQEIADVVGDSYYLSEISKNSDKEVIVFCGVRFMAESAKILSPNKKVLMPVLDAGCAMADMIDEEAVLNLKKQYPNAYVVCYINSTSNVKSHCDVAVTSSSALDILKNIEQKQIIFLPDKNLGGYISEFFPEKEFILYDGHCKYHNNIKVEDILKLKDMCIDVKVLVHPECTKDVRQLGDYVGSTSGIINYATNSDCKHFIIATEEGILHELELKNPNKKFYIPGGSISCIDMKKTTIQNLHDTLLNMNNEITMDDNISEKALRCLENMHSLAY